MPDSSAPVPTTDDAVARDASFVRLLERAAAGEAAADTIEDAILEVMREICRWTEWPLGHAYWAGAEELAPSDLWVCESDDERFVAFRESTAEMALRSGLGLPGAVAKTRSPRWIVDVTTDANFPRAQAAADAGLRGAFAFGVADVDRLYAVLEFFSTQRMEPDLRLLEVTAHLGAQLGRVISGRIAQQALRSSEERFRSVAQVSPDAIVASDQDGNITYWNDGATATFGHTEAEAIGRPLSILMPERFIADHDAGMRRVVEGGEAAGRILGTTVEVVGVHKDGHEFPVEMSLGTWVTDDGRFFSGVLRDISDRRRVEQRLRLLLESAPDAILEIDAEGHIKLANTQAEALFGRGAQDMIGLDAGELIIPTDRKLIRARFADALRRLADGADGGTDRIEARVLREDGSPRPVEITLRPLRTDTGTVVMAIARDMTERERFEAQLEHLSEHDGLTGLLNRGRFDSELARRVELGGGGALVVIDLDGFRRVNDAFGRSVGDEVIQAVGRMLEQRLPSSAVAARLDGDEFAVLLVDADAEHARTVADHLIEAVRDGTRRSLPHDDGVSASAGVVLLDTSTPDELTLRAELALHDAKEAGGAQSRLYDPDATAGAAARMRWTERLRRALDGDGFVLHCQPIFDLEAGRVTQYELLLRLTDEAGGLIPPLEFIDAAERSGQIQAVDRWVTGQAIDLIAASEAVGVPLRLEVNLSGRTIGDRQLVELIRRRLGETGIDPASLVFEITETAAIANMGRALEFAGELTALGCRFALDDFGTGFSSFYYLKRLPLDYVKIDGDFVRALAHNATDQLLVRSMVDVARGMGLRTIAEYVEDAATVAMLRRQGVDYSQGYFHGRPEPLVRALPWLEQPERLAS